MIEVPETRIEETPQVGRGEPVWIAPEREAELMQAWRAGAEDRERARLFRDKGVNPTDALPRVPADARFVPSRYPGTRSYDEGRWQTRLR